MLMEETNESRGQEQTEKFEQVTIKIGNYPVMESAIEVLSILGKKKENSFTIKGQFNTKCSCSSKYHNREIAKGELKSSKN